MKQIISIFLAGNVTPGSPSHSPFLCSSNFEYCLQRGTGFTKKVHGKNHRNVSIYPNTSLHISAAGLLFSVVGNANSRLPRQKRGLNLGLLHAFMLDKHLTLGHRKVGITTSLVSSLLSKIPFEKWK